MKRCGHCGETKPFSDFAKNRARSDGYAPQCKACLNAFNRTLQARNIERNAVKRCTKCAEVKPIVDFGRKSQTASGLHSWCRACVKVDNDQRVEANRAAHAVAPRPVPEAQKRCAGCGEHKSLDQFYKQSSQRDGLNPQCKVCVNAYNRAYAERNKERDAEWRRTAAQRQWAKRYLHLSREDYESYIATAAGQCQVCGRLEASISRNGNRHKLALDHDHATMKFRGVLCRACNTALGCVGDDPALLRKLAAYLEAGGIS